MTPAHETNNIMLDIETLDVRPSAVVLSIGMVKFDPVKHVLGDTYYQILSSEDQVQMERTQGDSTVKWWSEQSKEASSVLFQSAAADDDVHSVLMTMGEWMGPEPKVWGNGPLFDNAIVASLFDTYGVKLPWKHWHDRCYRTLCALGRRRMTPAWEKKLGPEPSREGVHHNALDDAKHQALIAMRYLRVL